MPTRAEKPAATRLWPHAGRSAEHQGQTPLNPDLFGTGEEVITFPTCNQYRLQGEMFSKAVRGEGELAMTMEESINNMKVLDALCASEKSAGWAEV